MGTHWCCPTSPRTFSLSFAVSRTTSRTGRLPSGRRRCCLLHAESAGWGRRRRRCWWRVKRRERGASRHRVVVVEGGRGRRDPSSMTCDHAQSRLARSSVATGRLMSDWPATGKGPSSRASLRRATGLGGCSCIRRAPRLPSSVMIDLALLPSLLTAAVLVQARCWCSSVGEELSQQGRRPFVIARRSAPVLRLRACFHPLQA